VGGLIVSGKVAQWSLFLAPYGATAAQNFWDASPAGQQGVLARAARAVAAVSAEVPVTVLLDDADRFDVTLITLMIDNLASRLDGQVLVVAAVHPGSELTAALQAPDRYGLAGRVVTTEADPDMSAASRTALARELLPGLPDSAIERIGQRTASFAEVFTVAGEKRLSDALTADGPAAVDMVDTVVDAVLAPDTPSAQVRVLAWAGGVLTERQADQALAILGEPSDPDDPEVIRAGGLARMRDRPPPTSPRRRISWRPRTEARSPLPCWPKRPASPGIPTPPLQNGPWPGSPPTGSAPTLTPRRS
jgi:hypothetical protein